MADYDPRTYIVPAIAKDQKNNNRLSAYEKRRPLGRRLPDRRLNGEVLRRRFVFRLN